MLAESLRIALVALRANKLRSALTMLGIIIGVSAVITLVSLGTGVRQSVETDLASLGTNTLSIYQGAFSMSGRSRGGGSGTTLTIDDAAAIEKQVPAVVATAPMVRGREQVVHGRFNWHTEIQGTTAAYREIGEWEVVLGRFITGRDVATRAKVAVLGHTVAKELFGDSDPVGVTIRIGAVPVKVIGLLGEKGGGLMGDSDDVVLVPISTAITRILGRNGGDPRAVGSLTVKVQNGEDLGAVEEEIADLLRTRHRVQPGDEDPFVISSIADLLEASQSTLSTLTFFLGAIASISLLVGGVGILNIMLVSVTERTREIGLRRALGARRRDIMMQFLVESVLLCLIGAAIGLTVGAAATWILRTASGLPASVTLEPTLFAIVVSTGVGIVFGFYPARQASRLNPIDALRYE